MLSKGAEHPYYAVASTAESWRNTKPDKCDYLKVNVYLPQEPGVDAPIEIQIQDWRTGELRTARFEVVQDSTAYRYETSTQRGAKGERQLERCLRKLNFTDITNIKYEGEHGLDLAARSPDGTACFFESKTTCRDGEPTLSEEQRRPEDYVTSRLRRAREYAADEAQQDAIEGFLAEELPLYLKSDFYVPAVNTTDWPHIEIAPWEDR